MLDLNLTLNTDTVALHPEPLVEHPPRQLLTPLPTPGHFLLVIDNSSLEVFTTCPKSADYKLVRRREAYARNAALTFGGAIHVGLESFLRAESDAAQDQAVLKFFTENPAPMDEWRTATAAMQVVAAYRARAVLPDYQWEIQSDEDGPLIERAFELPLGVLDVNAVIDLPNFPFTKSDLINNIYEAQQQLWYNALEVRANLSEALQKGMTSPVWVSQIHVAWSGRIDVVAKCGDPYIVRVNDHKSGRVDPMEYQIASQTIGYVWAARQLWPELNAQGFCLNALSTKKPAAGCSLTSTGPRGGKPALEMFRAYFEYSEERLSQWEQNTLSIVSDFIHNLVRQFHPRHTKWCFAKYGKCQYHDVCIQDDPAVRANMIKSDMFKNVTWNPVAGR